MQTIVVGVDSSEDSAAAVRWALDEADSRQLPLLVVHAWTLPPITTPGMAGAVVPNTSRRSELQRVADTVVEELVAKAQAERERPVTAVSLSAREGPPAFVLLETARGADQLVVGTRGAGGFSRMLLGSVTDQVVRHAECPVTVVRPLAGGAAPGLRRVVVGVDGSPASRAALGRAAAAARARGATLDIIQAYERVAFYTGGAVHPESGNEAHAAATRSLAGVVEGVLNDDLVTTRRRVEEGDPADVLLRAVEGAELLVLGARGRGGFLGLRLGGVGLKCLHHARCTIQVVPSAEAG